MMTFCGWWAPAHGDFFADRGTKGAQRVRKCLIGDALPFPSPATGQYTQEQKGGLIA
jgi:hypothetical protein